MSSGEPSIRNQKPVRSIRDQKPVPSPHLRLRDHQVQRVPLLRDHQVQRVPLLRDHQVQQPVQSMFLRDHQVQQPVQSIFLRDHQVQQPVQSIFLRDHQVQQPVQSIFLRYQQTKMSLGELNHRDQPQRVLIWKNMEEPFRCSGCKEQGLGPCYLWNENSCCFYLHLECADPDSSAFHPFMPNCNLKFHSKPPQVGERFCDACGKDIKGYVYQCTHREPHDFHPQCLKLRHFLTDRSRNVTVQLKKKLPMECFHCNSKKINYKIQGWCYVTTCGQYCYHIACVKELYLRNWNIDHLRRSGNNNHLAMVSVTPSHRLVVEQGRVGTSIIRNMKFWKTVITVFKLVVSALFGNPIAMAAAIGEHFLTN